MLFVRRYEDVRSIPACAGEPTSVRACSPLSKVYPRVCGGTNIRQDTLAAGYGLSPRVRGNPVAAVASEAKGGSIPACAGEPGNLAASFVLPQVYPRVCGGTYIAAGRIEEDRGLSPRVRGNLHL